MPSALCASCGAGGQAAAAKGNRGFRGRRDGVFGARSRGQRQPDYRQPVLSERASTAARGSTRTPALPRTRHAHTHATTHSSRHVTSSLSFPSPTLSSCRHLLSLRSIATDVSLLWCCLPAKTRPFRDSLSLPMRDWPGSGLEGRGRDFDRAPARAGGTVLRDWVASARVA